MPLTAHDKDDTFVGRIRDETQPKTPQPLDRER